MKKEPKDPLKDWFLEANTEKNPLDGHEQRFLRKLSYASRIGKQRRLSFRIAAMVLVLIGLFSNLNQDSYSVEENEFYQAQTYFQNTIENQLETLPLHEERYQILVKESQQRLKTLQQQYQSQMEQFQDGIDHPKLLSALIENLQKQLVIVQTLSEQIQKIKHEENESELL